MSEGRRVRKVGKWKRSGHGYCEGHARDYYYVHPPLCCCLWCVLQCPLLRRGARDVVGEDGGMQANEDRNQARGASSEMPMPEDKVRQTWCR